MAGYFDLGSLTPDRQTEGGTGANANAYNGFGASSILSNGDQARFATGSELDGAYNSYNGELRKGLSYDMQKAQGRFDRNIGQGNQTAGEQNAFGTGNSYTSQLDLNGQTGTFGGTRQSGFRTAGGDPNTRVGFSAQADTGQYSGHQGLSVADGYRNTMQVKGAFGVGSNPTSGLGSFGFESGMSKDHLRRVIGQFRPGQTTVAGRGFANNALGNGASRFGNYGQLMM